MTRPDRARLQTVLREQRGEARAYRRARLVLMLSRGASISSVARSLGTCRSRVLEWADRYRARGIQGLQDRPRSGRPAILTSLERHQVIALACRQPRSYGVARNTWTHESLRSALVRAGLVRAISTSEVGRILDAADLKPHRVKRWCHSDDPDFQTKMRAIVRLYVHPPPGEPVLCIDEKTGMQALSRSRELQLARPGKSGRQEFEYRRHGTRCLFACFNVGTGKVLGRCTSSRKRTDFFSFLDRVAACYRQRRVHVILDNLNTHKNTSQGNFITDWNRRHGRRFVFHYTPTHGSWLNQVELWFGIVTRRVLRHGSFQTPDELIQAVVQFTERWNRSEAHPFRWTYEGLPLVR